MMYFNQHQHRQMHVAYQPEMEHVWEGLVYRSVGFILIGGMDKFLYMKEFYLPIPVPHFFHPETLTGPPLSHREMFSKCLFSYLWCN